MKLFISDVHGDFNGLEMLPRHTEIDFTKDQLILAATISIEVQTAEKLSGESEN